MICMSFCCSTFSESMSRLLPLSNQKFAILIWEICVVIIYARRNDHIYSFEKLLLVSLMRNVVNVFDVHSVMCTSSASIGRYSTKSSVCALKNLEFVFLFFSNIFFLHFFCESINEYTSIHYEYSTHWILDNKFCSRFGKWSKSMHKFIKTKKNQKKNECRVYNEKIKCTKFTSSSNNSQSIRFPMDFHTFKLNWVEYVELAALSFQTVKLKKLCASTRWYSSSSS